MKKGKMKLIGSVLSVGGFTVLSRLTGFLRESLQAHYIGVNVVSDALGIAIKIPSLFRRVLAEGAFNASFVPMFSGLLASEGRKEALEFAQNVFSLLFLVLLGLVVGIEMFLPELIPLFFRGLAQTPERLELTIQFSKITFPFLFFISLTAFFSGILNSFERFIATSSSPVIGNLFIIAALVYLSPSTLSPGYALAMGILWCGVAQLLWVFIPCQISKIRIMPKIPKITPNVKKFLKILLPAALGSSVVQINLFLDITMASYLKVGGISYMNYADRLAQLPLSVIGISMSTVLLPTLAKHLRKNNRAQALEVQTLAIETSMLAAIPSTTALIILAHFLVEVLYGHGEFTIENIAPTARTLQALASGLPAYILIKLFTTTFFSSGDTKTPTIIGAGSVVLNVTLNLLLIGSLEYVGLAMATSISAWVQAFILAYILRKKNLLGLTKSILNFLRDLIIPYGALVLYLMWGVPQLDQFLRKMGLSSILVLPLVFLGGVLIYLGIAYKTGIFSPKRIRTSLGE
jgi:putative peptidoglycan lipid II flippase